VNALLQRLATNEIFEVLSDGERAQVAALFESTSLPAGSFIYHGGEHRHRLYFVQEGRIEVLGGEGLQDKVVLAYREGNYFGEACLLDESAHSTSARVVEDSRLWFLERERFLAFLEQNPHAGARMLARAGRVVFRRLMAGLSSGGQEGVASVYQTGETREEHDLIGTLHLPENAYYGAQSMRALENYDISGIRISHFPNFIRALAMVKKAAAQANMRLEMLEPEIGEAICRACDDILNGHLHNQFVVDMIQGGAGTSTNMNANEVIANRALEILGQPKGSYSVVHPNDHVNLSQSTNDVYPTAFRLAILLSYPQLLEAMDDLVVALKHKARDFEWVIKMGRTQLQDAVPMTLGQEFLSWAHAVEEDMDRVRETARQFLETNLGGTAIGTGICADPAYPQEALRALRRVTGMDFRLCPDMIEASSDTSSLQAFSGILRRVAVKLSKICNDLRLLSSGPRCGFGEINLPPRAAGSSIMPGKVNPVIPEVVNQVAYQVVGNDLTVTMAAENGQLQLNVMEPVIVFNLFQSIDMLTRAYSTLRRFCIEGITANEEHCRDMVLNSIGLVTALLPHIGYTRATQVAKEALKSGTPVAELVRGHGWLTDAQISNILDPQNMIRHGQPAGQPVLAGPTA
jgi:aspartate ammonia-lyase